MDKILLSIIVLLIFLHFLKLFLLTNYLRFFKVEDVIHKLII